MATYVDQNYDFDLLEFNAYKDQPYHLYPEFKHVPIRKLKNPRRRIMISHVRERLNIDSKILRAQAVFIDWLVQNEICTAQQIVYVVGCQDEFYFLESYRQACLQENVSPFTAKRKTTQYRNRCRYEWFDYRRYRENIRE